MLSSDIPSKVPLPFADTGTKNVIPTASQIGITPGAASLTDGFPPLTMTPIAAGGIPPAGADFNGILNLITAVQQWQSAGGIFKYDAAFSTAIGGYPAGAVLMGTDDKTFWLNLADDNTTDPDGATPANWAPLAAYGIGAVAGLTNANVTLSPAQYSKPVITLAGTLTGNVQIIFPNIVGEWNVVNNATGAFTATCKTASGTGVVIAQGGGTEIRGDGTNIDYCVGIAPQAEAEAGAATTLRGWSALRVRQAIAAAITALVVQATETVKGIAEIATQAETNAGSDDARIVTPLKLRSGLAYSLGSTGYITFPVWMGSLIIMWGSVTTSSSSETSFPFPIALTTALYQAFATSGPGNFATVIPTVTPLATINVSSWTDNVTRTVTGTGVLIIGK